tara:strand:- start:8314 stop:9309 length:996 start_codon:yes stop_codon:yes gene_type:complete
MIVKSFNLNNIKKKDFKFFLFYGENEGQKDDTITNCFLENFSGEILKYEENQILENKDAFFEVCLNESLFKKNKIIIVSRVTSKLCDLIKQLTDKKIYNIKIIFKSDQLEKRSKIRELFEKNEYLICTAFYEDSSASLFKIAYNFFNENKITISSENINLLIDKCCGDRKNLQNEMNKILNFCFEKKKITTEEITKLINLYEDENIFELIDLCLIKNRNKVIKKINSTTYGKNETIALLRTFLSRLKRLIILKKLMINNEDIHSAINTYKPPIFWKEKDIVQKQMKIWSLAQMYILVEQLNNLEIRYKKNSELSNNLILDLILNTCEKTNN